MHVSLSNNHRANNLNYSDCSDRVMGSDRHVNSVVPRTLSFAPSVLISLMVLSLDDQCLVACANCSGPIEGDGSHEGVETFALASLFINKGVETFVGAGPLW